MAISFSRLENITAALKANQQTGRNFHATFVYHGNKLLCIAHNDYTKLHRYHKFGDYKGKHDRTGNYTSGIHGECSALIKLGLSDCSHLTFVNVRVDNSGKPAISKPCANCQRLLDQVGFKNLWYFDGQEYVKKKY